MQSDQSRLAVNNPLPGVLSFSKRSSHIPFHISFPFKSLFSWHLFFFFFPLYTFSLLYGLKLSSHFLFLFHVVLSFKCDISPTALSPRPNFPALSQATSFAITLSQPLCHEHFPLSLHVHKHTGASHLLLRQSPHFFSCAHLRIKQMQHTQTEYSSSCSHKPVKAYRPRSYLCINLNLLRGSNLLKGNKAKGYIIIFGVDPTGLGGWLLAPL